MEKETVIIFNDGEKEATITTCNPTWLRKLKELWGAGERLGEGPFWQWVIPKNRIFLPRPKKSVSEAIREKRRQGGVRLAKTSVLRSKSQDAIIVSEAPARKG